jgi:hypothetical protein
LSPSRERGVLSEQNTFSERAYARSSFHVRRLMKKTYRVKLHLDGDNKPRIYRTDGVPTHCCSFAIDYFCWEKNTKFNGYYGWRGYVTKSAISKSLKTFNPDNLTI